MIQKIGYGFLQSGVDQNSSSRAVLVFGTAGIFIFFLGVCLGIAMGWTTWAAWDGPMEWLKWAFIAVILPYAANKVGKVGQKNVVQQVEGKEAEANA